MQIYVLLLTTLPLLNCVSTYTLDATLLARRELQIQAELNEPILSNIRTLQKIGPELQFVDGLHQRAKSQELNPEVILELLPNRRSQMSQNIAKHMIDFLQDPDTSLDTFVNFAIDDLAHEIQLRRAASWSILDSWAGNDLIIRFFKHTPVSRPYPLRAEFILLYSSEIEGFTHVYANRLMDKALNLYFVWDSITRANTLLSLKNQPAAYSTSFTLNARNVAAIVLQNAQSLFKTKLLPEQSIWDPYSPFRVALKKMRDDLHDRRELELEQLEKNAVTAMTRKIILTFSLENDDDGPLSQVAGPYFTAAIHDFFTTENDPQENQLRNILGTTLSRINNIFTDLTADEEIGAITIEEKNSVIICFLTTLFSPINYHESLLEQAKEIVVNMRAALAEATRDQEMTRAESPIDNSDIVDATGHGSIMLRSSFNKLKERGMLRCPFTRTRLLLEEPIPLRGTLIPHLRSLNKLPAHASDIQEIDMVSGVEEFHITRDDAVRLLRVLGVPSSEDIRLLGSRAESFNLRRLKNKLLGRRAAQ